MREGGPQSKGDELFDRLARWAGSRRSRREVMQVAAAASIAYAALPRRSLLAFAQSGECSADCDAVYDACYESELKQIEKVWEACSAAAGGGGQLLGFGCDDDSCTIKLRDGTLGAALTCDVKYMSGEVRAEKYCRQLQYQCDRDQRLCPQCGGGTGVECTPPRICCNGKCVSKESAPNCGRCNSGPCDGSLGCACVCFQGKFGCYQTTGADEPPCPDGNTGSVGMPDPSPCR
jgi:hypothetical protein